MQTDNKKTILGWALYDWANSAFATTIGGLLPAVFKQF
jgi:UMF1 family MFS transporter